MNTDQFNDGTEVMHRTAEYHPHRCWRTWLIGLLLPTADALSSTAYVTQEMLFILAMAGTAAFGYVFPISIVIAGLIIIVTISNEIITIIVPQFVPNHWSHNLLHTQTAFILRLAILFKPGMVITDVPYTTN